jgi:hypothetical protein
MKFLLTLFRYWVTTVRVTLRSDRFEACSRFSAMWLSYLPATMERNLAIAYGDWLRRRGP